MTHNDETKKIETVDTRIAPTTPRESSEQAQTEEESKLQAANKVTTSTKRKRIVAIVAACAVVLCAVGVAAGYALGWPGQTAAGVSGSTSHTEATAQHVQDEKGTDSDAETQAKEDSEEGSQTNEQQAADGSTQTQGETSAAASGADQTSAADGAESASGTGQSSAPAEQQAPQPEPAPAAPVQPQQVSVSVYVDSSRAASFGWPSCMASTSVMVAPGSSVYDALCATGVSVGGSSSYVSSINGLAEFSCGSGSGWLYFVNGSSPGFSCGSYLLYGGESITWFYTLDGSA